MTLLSLKPHQHGAIATAYAAPAPALRVCRFERTLMGSPILEGGVLTCLVDGYERRLAVAMTWDVLARLRAELIRHGAGQPDEVVMRGVLRTWAPREYAAHLARHSSLPAEGLVLQSLGGPDSTTPRELLQDAGLLPSSPEPLGAA